MKNRAGLGRLRKGTPGSSQTCARPAENPPRCTAALVLALLLALLGLLECLVPLRRAVQIGADEGFELAKALLVANGYRLYTEVWNDQPPLHTFLVAWASKQVSQSVLVPRLITVGFSAVLVASLYLSAVRPSGVFVAALAAGLLIVSPGFLELSSSCMLEIPAAATAAAALAVLFWTQGAALAKTGGLPDQLGFRETQDSVGKRPSVARADACGKAWSPGLWMAGLMFGTALQLKLTAALLLPVAGLVLASATCVAKRPWKELFAGGVRVGCAMGLSVAAVHMFIGDDAYFQQLWTSHFAEARSFEYGSAADHPFDWTIFLKNWDLAVPACLGIVISLRRARADVVALVPVLWLAVALGVHATHTPWWPYYYLHLALPLCWLAALALHSAC